MDSTKDLITEEAFKLFLNHGYEAVSINDISNVFGVTKGVLHHHFKNKEELFKSVLNKYLFIPEAIADFQTISLSEYIQLSVAHAEKIIRTLFSVTLDFTPIDYMSLFVDAIRHYPGYPELRADFIGNEIEKTKKVLKNAIRSDEIRNDINSELIATSFFSIYIGLAGNLVRNNSIDAAINL